MKSPLLDLLFSDAKERIYARIDENVKMAKAAMIALYAESKYRKDEILTEKYGLQRQLGLSSLEQQRALIQNLAGQMSPLTQQMAAMNRNYQVNPQAYGGLFGGLGAVGGSAASGGLF